jgi:RNA polymerase sigma-70 factor (ECF subfamily)
MTDVTVGYATQRPLMFAIAYRMTGSVTEAEDIVQDALVRLLRDRTDVANLDAFATTITTRLAIDHLRSARVRREAYVGQWLPEPALSVDPADVVDRHESLSMAMLVLLERLSPAERAAFVLREAFGYPYDQIAEIIGRSPDSTRQLVARARARIADDRPRFEPSSQAHADLARRFLAACQDGDFEALEALLATDVKFHGDGGGKAPALARPVDGSKQVARFLLGLFRRAAKEGARLEPSTVNGQPGAKIYAADGMLLSVLALQIADGQVVALYNVLNPDKLHHLRLSS